MHSRKSLVSYGMLRSPQLKPGYLMQSGSAARAALDHSDLDLGWLLQAAKLRRTMTEAEDRKQKNRIAHSKPGSVIVKPARKKKIVAELE